MANQRTPGQRCYEVYAKHMQKQHAMPLWRLLLPDMQDAWEAAAHAVRADVHDALTLAVQYGQIDGDHHKAWVIDQMCRALLETEEAYRQFVRDACMGDDGPDTYGWNEGIAP